MIFYVEYISRRPGIPLEDFRALTGYTQPRWSAEFPEDQLLLNLGRTWRVGLEPEYLAVWFNRTASLDRLDSWGQTFAGAESIPELPVIEHAFLATARIDQAGLFDPLVEPVPGGDEAYYAEFFAAGDETPAAAIAEAFAERTGDGATLRVLGRRIGLLGVDPGIAIWSAASFAALEPTIRARSPRGVAAATRGALYADLGKEIL